jgi:hypothetical protein
MSYIPQRDVDEQYGHKSAPAYGDVPQMYQPHGQAYAVPPRSQ